MTNFFDIPTLELAGMLRAGEVTSVKVTEFALDRIGRVDNSIHAFIQVTPDRAITDAKRADAELEAGNDRGPLHGIPIAIKDIYDTAGIETTCHSKLLIGNVPSQDSVVARRFAASGSVLLGKLATNEFAWGGPANDLPFPLALNPWNRDHFTGGSSSGSAAAIAARYLRIAPGSDTGGSIRGPSSYCGTVGIKPTFGLVPRTGVFPLAWSLDHLGPLTRSVEDAAVSLQVMAGYDATDTACADLPVPDYAMAMNAGVNGKRIGVPRHFFMDHVNPEVLAGVEHSISALRDAGAILEDMTLPDFRLFAGVSRVLLMAEGYAIHRENARKRLHDYAGINQERIIVASTISAADYIDALRLRAQLIEQVNVQLARYDALLTVTTLDTAPPLDVIANPMGSASPMQTTPTNTTGHPSLSLPVRLAANGLPTAVQIIGRPFDEATVFAVAKAIEDRAEWRDVAFPEFG